MVDEHHHSFRLSTRLKHHSVGHHRGGRLARTLRRLGSRLTINDMISIISIPVICSSPGRTRTAPNPEILYSYGQSRSTTGRRRRSVATKQAPFKDWKTGRLLFGDEAGHSPKEGTQYIESSPSSPSSKGHSMFNSPGTWCMWIFHPFPSPLAAILLSSTDTTDVS